MGAWIIARQIAPGLRMRAVVSLNTERPKSDEASVRRLFDQATASLCAQRIVRCCEGLAR